MVYAVVAVHTSARKHNVQNQFLLRNDFSVLNQQIAVVARQNLISHRLNLFDAGGAGLLIYILVGILQFQFTAVFHCVTSQDYYTLRSVNGAIAPESSGSRWNTVRQFRML